MTAPRFLTLSDVADELQVSLSQVRALVRSGEPPFRLVAVISGALNALVLKNILTSATHRLWKLSLPARCPQPALRLISLLAAGNHSTYKGRRDNPYALLCAPPRV